jgi:hypothetical protein
MQRCFEIDDESRTEKLCELVGFDHPFWLENTDCQEATFGYQHQFIHIIGDVLDQSLEYNHPREIVAFEKQKRRKEKSVRVLNRSNFESGFASLCSFG